MESDGDPVGGWTDRGSQSYHATQATAAKRGTYRPSAANGRGAVEFDGTDDYMVVGQMTGRLGNGFTLLLMMKVFNGQPASLQRPFGSRVNTVRQAYFDLLLNTSGVLSHTVWVDHASYIQTIQSLASGESNWLLIACVATPGGALACYQNGTLIGSVSLAGATWSNIAGSLPESPFVGAVSIGGVDMGHCDCQVAEVLIYDRPLNNSERQSVEAYAREKYGL